MKRTTSASALVLSLLSALAIALSSAPAGADPLDALFGSAGGTGSLDSGSAALGSSDNTPKHFGKLGRPDAPNGVKSINTWVYAPKSKPVAPGVYGKGAGVGVRWNSTIDAGPVIDGNECAIAVRLSGPRVPKSAQLTRTRDCTATKTFVLRAPGNYTISVTDGISGASNKIAFTIR
ncbi:hypothetical protein [Gordonia soli]|uniref:Uncharacterized protein n=1 Tax=Gordonia soli NBRC 108243 TaxID=1223545 RepID=M0QIJ7_9ACTN|nr:hypothetical protein [Gordonia soli]GAC68353.1 hypothetical protein GS4_15_00020 [Gordonia soli NBRC 108243]